MICPQVSVTTQLHVPPTQYSSPEQNKMMMLEREIILTDLLLIMVLLPLLINCCAPAKVANPYSDIFNREAIREAPLLVIATRE